MERNISWKKLWNIIVDVELNDGSNDIALERITQLLKAVPGQLQIKERKLCFIPNAYDLNYKYSTSIIGSEDYQMRVENHKHAINEKLEEEDVIKWMLDHINDEFYSYDENVLIIFWERYLCNYSINQIKDKHYIGSKKYYLYIETAEYLFKEAMLINKKYYYKINLDGSYEKINETE